MEHIISVLSVIFFFQMMTLGVEGTATNARIKDTTKGLIKFFHERLPAVVSERFKVCRPQAPPQLQRERYHMTSHE